MQLSLSFLDRAFQEAENISPCKVIYEWGSGALSGADWCEISGICGAAVQLVGICTNFHFHFLLSISKRSTGPRPASWSILAATCASNYEHFSPAQLSRGFSLHFCSQFQTDTSPLPGKHCTHFRRPSFFLRQASLAEESFSNYILLAQCVFWAFRTPSLGITNFLQLGKLWGAHIISDKNVQIRSWKKFHLFMFQF